MFVDENKIQNVVEWKDTETAAAGNQKLNKGTLKKGIIEEEASCWKCNIIYKTKNF